MENLQENLTKISPKEIAQTPLAYALYVVVAVLVSVIIGQQIDHNADKAQWQAQEKDYQNAIKAERVEKDEVFKAYLASKLANEQIQKTVDSTAIQKVKNLK